MFICLFRNLCLFLASIQFMNELTQKKIDICMITSQPKLVKPFFYPGKLVSEFGVIASNRVQANHKFSKRLGKMSEGRNLILRAERFFLIARYLLFSNRYFFRLVKKLRWTSQGMSLHYFKLRNMHRKMIIPMILTFFNTQKLSNFSMSWNSSESAKRWIHWVTRGGSCQRSYSRLRTHKKVDILSEIKENGTKSLTVWL